MKLRLDNKSVRFRLSKEEILKLQNEGFVEEKLSFNEDNYFSYVIEVLDDIEECELNFNEDGLQIGIPLDVSEKWINSNQVGIKETFDTEDGELITLFVEEDLPPRKHK
jgi:hypothetical protein